MIRDPFDIDKFFREVERHIEESFRRTGGYKYDSFDRHSTYDDFFMEDDKKIYLTVEIAIDPKSLKAKVEDEDELVISIDNGIERIKLPTKVDKVESITCVNGILDIVIRKKKDGNGEREEDEAIRQHRTD
jgi:HSP20 family molecular chaperone IbpA